MPDQDVVLQAVKLAKTGQRVKARLLILGELERNPTNAQAWAILAQLAQNRKEAIRALKRVQRLKPNSEWARQYLARLRQEGSPDKTPVWLIGALATLAVILWLQVLAVVTPLQRMGGPSPVEALPENQEQAILQQVSELPLAECSAFIDQALLVSDQGCQSVGRNQACYGNYTLDAEMVSAASDPFEQTGDITPIEELHLLKASPLDLGASEWGVAIFKLQANLPRTIPGQLVTFLVYGNTSLENASGDMQAIFFSTGLGNVTCDLVAFDGLLIQTPEDAGLAIEVNETDLSIFGNSVAVLEAQPGGEMTVSVLDGEAAVSTHGREQPIAAGNAVKVPLGGEDGLHASGPPSGPKALDSQSEKLNCAFLDTDCPPPVELADLAPTNTSVPAAPGQPTNTPVPIPTRTPGLPTWTPRPDATDTPRPTDEPGTSQSDKSEPTNTPKPSDTPVPTDTNTSGTTNIHTPTPTNTHTPVPTSTHTPVPTNTPTDVPSQTTTFSPIADAWVEQDAPDTNHGGATGLEVDGSPVKIVYLKFDWSSLAGQTIEEATLRLRIFDSSNSQQKIWLVDDSSWTESGTTYNNRPSRSTQLDSINGGSAGQWIEIDVTGGVQQKAGQLFSITLDSTGSNGLDFYSREHSSDSPELIVRHSG